MKFIWGLGLILATCSFAQALVLEKEYLSGPEVCAHHQEERSEEHGLWVQVPLDYSQPQKGTTLLYAWTKGPFNPEKKTVIFVSGGPGESAHGTSLSLDNWNIVFFDQRGVACSRPETRERYLSKDFYSSESTARDIDEIRKALQLSTISIYGVSYGTIPAHMYAFLFPQFTRSLVLEGVIAKSDAPTLIENSRRRKMLQKFFNSLPANYQERILELNQMQEVSPTWFSNVGKMMFYLDDPTEVFGQFLDNVLWDDETILNLIASFQDKEPVDIEYTSNNVAMGMLSCQELGMNTRTSFYSVFAESRLIPYQDDFLQTNFCTSLGFATNEPMRVFDVKDYPLQVPVTYFQGFQDGATSADQALRSFKIAARGKAQLILAKKGGHSPLDRKSTRLNSSHTDISRMPSSA